jgi:hypothetical protein
MRRPTTLVTLGLLAAATLTACGGTDAPSAGSSSSGSATTTATTTASAPPAIAAASPEQVFLSFTAAHLCASQSTVFADAAAQARAFSATPEYPGLSDQQVATYQARLTSDATFRAALTREVEEACAG